MWVWVDVAVPPTAAAGDYTATWDLIQDGRKASSVELKLKVYNFVLPDERHLHLVGRVDWNNLGRQYPESFETVTPELLNRKDAKYAGTIRLLDSLVKLGHQHRTEVVVPRLQPVVKWPAGKPPQVDWEGFDSVAGPWLRGDAFADRVPVGYWPLPRPDYLDRYDLRSQGEYWVAAANHFDQLDWLPRSPVPMTKPTPGRADTIEAVQLSQQAAWLLGLHPKLRAVVPLEDEQVQFKGEQTPMLFDADASDRLVTAGANIAFATPSKHGRCDPTANPPPRRNTGCARIWPAWCRTWATSATCGCGAGWPSSAGPAWPSGTTCCPATPRAPSRPTPTS